MEFLISVYLFGSYFNQKQYKLAGFL